MYPSSVLPSPPALLGHHQDSFQISGWVSGTNCLASPRWSWAQLASWGRQIPVQLDLCRPQEKELGLVGRPSGDESFGGSLSASRTALLKDGGIPALSRPLGLTMLARIPPR